MPVAPASLAIPGFTAYAEPDPEAFEIPATDPIQGWSDSKTTIAWYGLIRTPGKLDVAVRLHLPTGAQSRLSMKVGDHELKSKTVRGADGMVTVSFGSLNIEQAGGYRFALSGVKKSGQDFAEIDSLILTGPAVKNALFNLTPQRGAPSVHLNFSLPDGVQAKWFYNEVTVKTDPVWSYYEACGFARGYFGIQVNSPTERRIIFSVWDSGTEPTDRDKVSAENQVQLIAKGPDVFVSGFGNEGTGGHSHLIYPWKTGETYRFLVSAQPEGNSTIYTGYFYFPEKHAWGLIASFRAPKDGGYLRHLYSFNEDFEGSNGQQRRLAEFGNQWIKTTDDKWMELTKARFTHTARGIYKDRLDRGAGVIGDRFYLTNGGFKAESIEFNDEISRPASGHIPDVELPVDADKQ
ncbi:DUF3472 domain-containing protein [Silvibacterium dinghuense]|uniref:DUF3472 domain-containing protein n=2 Tax=Silvibacterium dinghuense TaxID=1560006 RepID=A0A4Q1SFW1_9BACT|nr:DUF3472 domain-containing protein [Silvibacterium dinghuense]GGH10871.1 hypothetical protein GCM10011586_29380 [Silvibacterium dinghuense]